MKQTFPDEGECVFCTVTKVQYNSVFVNLNEYQNKSGMIHISEISPGRIRNIRDYVKEGKVIICKVLRVKKDRGHIDLSLRRVTESQRRSKIEERKQQAIAENIIKSYAKQYDVKADDFEKVVIQTIGDRTMYAVFEDVVENDLSLEELGLDKKVAGQLEEIIRERIKPKQVEIQGVFTVKNYESDGVERINTFMKKVAGLDEALVIHFLGAGRFKLLMTGPDYATCEKVFNTFRELMDKEFDGTPTEHSFVRD